jgi:hypothetical protein
MFKKSLSAVMTALAAAVLVSACGGGGGGGGGGGYVDPGYQAWYDVYGYKCGYAPGPGCNFYANGYKIIDVEDPYFSSYYSLSYGTVSYYDSYGYYSTYSGWTWKSPNGIYYDYYGDALNDDSGAGRDFAADVAQQEQNVVKSAGEFFAAKYSLDAATGVKVAKILHDYAELGKSRARTEADIADFSKRLYGQDLNKVKGALAEAMKGNKTQLNSVVEEAATNWSTTPETMKEILKVWYGKDAGQLL